MIHNSFVVHFAFQNPRYEIEQLAKFLEVSLCDESLNEITTKTSFDKMKQDADETQNMGTKMFRNFNMRKGIQSRARFRSARALHLNVQTFFPSFLRDRRTFAPRNELKL